VTIDECGSFADVLSTEPALLAAFWAQLSADAPLVISWNGRGFDVPVLLHRSFLHGIPARPWFDHGGVNRYRNYGYRYGDRHIDLMDVMADYGAVRSYGLDVTAQAAGLPGKIGGSGAEVAGMYANGELGDIRAYCECDCLNLFGVFLRWSLISGRLSDAGFASSVRKFQDFVSHLSERTEHIGAFWNAWRAIAA
jgi:predicted PolB exonuclease-like 3'-5' exonuclease